MTDNYEWHDNRYRMSIAWMEPYIQNGSNVLELGGTTPFTDVIKQRFPESTFSSTGENDLRHVLPWESDSYDVILCMEVIEHISDTPVNDIGSIATFKCSGIANMLREAYRLLKPNGVMFLSTPNICGYRAITNILRGTHPFTYDLHTRELSVPDLKKHVSSAGFIVEKIKTERVWHWNDVNFDYINTLLSYFGCSTDNRDDCIFLLARKPSVL